MPICDPAHASLDPVANGELQFGPLPRWTRVQGNAVWFVWRGPLEMLGEAWVFFHRKVRARDPGRPDGPPGEVFVCRPEDHADEHPSRLLTILYLPLAGPAPE